MKRFSLLAIALAMALVLGLAGTTMAQLTDSEESTVTVKVEKYINIWNLDDIPITIAFSGTPAVGSGDGSDPFKVDTNVPVNLAVSLASGTIAGGNYSASVTPTSITDIGPGKDAELSVDVSNIPLTTTPGDYKVTLTVTATEKS